MRIGWGYAPPAVIDVLNRVRGAVQRVDRRAGRRRSRRWPSPAGWRRAARTTPSTGRSWRPGWQAAGIKVWPSEGNFVLADFGTPERAKAADAFLRTRGIIVRPVAGYGLPHCLRITVGTAEECGIVDRRADRTSCRAARWLNRCSVA